MRFCLSNELRQRSQDLLGLCIMQRFPQSRPQSRELLHPTRLPLKNELSSSSPMFEECSLRDACSALSGGSPQPSPSRTLELIQQKFKAVGGKPTHPPSNFEVLPENVQAFLGKGQWLSDSDFTHFPEAPNQGGSCQATAMQKSSFASSGPNICTQGSQPPPWQLLLACKTLPLFFFFFKLRVNIFFFLILLSWHSLLGAKELLRNQGLVRISIFSVYLLNFTFPDDSRLGRCAKSVSADTPPAVHLLFLLISFPRSILCQTYSSGVGRYLYIYRLQRENKSWTCYTTLKKQPNFQQTLFAV